MRTFCTMGVEQSEHSHDDVALLRGAIDKISAMLAYWDSDLRCRFANRAYERWFGVSPESLIGKHLSELLGPLYDLNRPYIEGALRGEPQEFERAIPDPTGGPVRYSLANYIPDVSNGVVRGFFAFVADISATRRAQVALAESEARYAGIIAIATDAIIGIDGDQRIRIFNTGAERIFGYLESEAIGRDIDLLIPSRFHETHRRHIAQFATEGRGSRQMGERLTTIVGVRKNGEEFPAEASISKLVLRGSPFLTVALRDIAERKRFELEQAVLAEAGAALASATDCRKTLKSIAGLVVRHLAELCVVELLENEPERVAVAHADPAMAMACEALARVSLPRTHPVAIAAIDGRQAQILDDITPAYLDESAQSEEHRLALRALAPRSSIVVPMLSAGSVVGLIMLSSSRPHHFAARDVTFATELARRAASAIENARLHEAERRATKARDDILGIVVHDLRSPLNAIALSAEFLGRKVREPGLQEYVESIRRSIHRANRLIEDLLDVTRIEAGVLGLARTIVAARPVVEEAVASQGPRASASSLELRIDVDAALPSLWADRDRILQVLENLVGNAIKFTPKGGRITAAAAQRAGEIMFSVSDTGSGIAAEALPHVFDRFWQADQAERRGAGLGLAICKGIVEAHGGEIWVESTPGRGTTVCFTIPLAAAAGASSPHLGSAEPPASAARS